MEREREREREREGGGGREGWVDAGMGKIGWQMRRDIKEKQNPLTLTKKETLCSTSMKTFERKKIYRKEKRRKKERTHR